MGGVNGPIAGQLLMTDDLADDLVNTSCHFGTESAEAWERLVVIIVITFLWEAIRSLSCCYNLRQKSLQGVNSIQ